METKKLYYDNPYLTHFTAKVLSCERGKETCAVVLDQTAFYPEGGGQPADHGILNGSVVVSDVHEKDGVIVHTCSQPLAVGSEVSGEIDWGRRFDLMQQHSGEHLFSGILHQLTGFENVGFHLGAESVTVDFSGEVSDALAQKAETLANFYIYSDAPAEIRLYSHEELKELEYRSKKEIPGDVRIVSFPGADCCACCGTHVRSAGQVGMVKVLSNQKFREGSRLELICGQRALDYLRRLLAQNTAISQALSAKAMETAGAVLRMKEELAAEKLRAGALEEQLFALKAEALRNSGNTLLIEPPLSSESTRRLADAVSRVCGGRSAVFAGGNGRYTYAIIDPADDLRALTKELNAALNGRGGGKPGFAQGSAETEEAAIRAFFSGR